MTMKLKKTPIEGVLIIEPDIFSDHRGCFWESYHHKRYTAAGIKTEFVQDNISVSEKNTLRGLHYQHPNDQAKLLQVLQGEVYDVAVDIRYGSQTFGKWIGVTLSGENRLQLFIPTGFAHGFFVISDVAVFSYKCSDFYASENEGGILWSDPNIGIDWPTKTPLLSDKDMVCPCLKDVPRDRLPIYTGR